MVFFEFVLGFSLPGAVTARRSGRVWLGFMRMVTIDRCYRKSGVGDVPCIACKYSRVRQGKYTLSGRLRFRIVLECASRNQRRVGMQMTCNSGVRS